MKIREYKNEYYDKKKAYYENLMGEDKVLNPKYLKKELAQLKKRYLLVESGMGLWVSDMESLKDAENALERLGGQYTAVNEIIAINGKRYANMIKEAMVKADFHL